jgi:hydrogenase maturation protein HypF
MERRRIVIRGVVQGVGFRPFVHRLATRWGVGGFALNDGSGVVVEVEGDPVVLGLFTGELVEEAPPHASVEKLATSRVPLRGEREFRIESSAGAAAGALVPPDIDQRDRLSTLRPA